MLPKHRIIFHQLVVIVISLWLANPTAQASSGRILKSASELDYPPFAIVRPDGSADGFSVELLKAVTKAVDLEVNITVGPWHEIKQKLADRHLDVLPLVSYSQERDKVYDFTIPYLQMDGTIFVREGEKSIRRESDLKDKEVLVMRSDTAHEYALSKNLSEKLILTDSFEEAMQLLSAGKHDAVICQYIMGLQLIKKLGISNVVSVSTSRELTLRPLGKSLTGFTQKFCFAVQEGDEKTLALLNEGLSIVEANGTYDTLYSKWITPILPRPPVPYTIVVKYLLFILIPVLLLLVISWVFVLRRQVARKTESLKAETRVREEAFDIINRSASIAFLWKNAEDWPVEFVSDNVLQLTGYSSQEFLSGEILYSRIIHPDDLKRVSRDVAQASEDPGIEKFTHKPYRIITKNKEIKWVADHTHLRKDEEGRITHYQGIVEDITAREKAELALRKSQEEWEKTFNAITDIVSLQDTSMKIVKINKTGCDTLGLPYEDIIGHHCYEFFHGSNEPCPECPLLVTKETFKPYTQEITHEKLGKTFLVSASPVLDDQGKLTHIAHVAKDITEIKALRGIIPICAKCHKIRNDEGYWQRVEQYIAEHTEAVFSHGMCKPCSDELYGGQDWYENAKKTGEIPD